MWAPWDLPRVQSSACCRLQFMRVKREISFPFLHFPYLSLCLDILPILFPVCQTLFPIAFSSHCTEKFFLSRSLHTHPVPSSTSPITASRPPPPQLFLFPGLRHNLPFLPLDHHFLSGSCPLRPARGSCIDLSVMPECLWRLRSTRVKHRSEPQDLNPTSVCRVSIIELSAHRALCTRWCRVGKGGMISQGSSVWGRPTKPASPRAGKPSSAARRETTVHHGSWRKCCLTGSHNKERPPKKLLTSKQPSGLWVVFFSPIIPRIAGLNFSAC